MNTQELRKLKSLDELYAEIDQLQAELAEAKRHIVFVERWANHHGTKPHMTAAEALSCIQHYPPILAITRNYVDGKVPETPNPWKENDELRAKLATLEAEKAEREKQEPAAWLSVDSIGERYLCFTKPEDGDEVHPLYLSAGAQPREPMTKDEMADMFKAVGIDGYDEREKLVRAVEAHHKIGAKE